MHWRATAWFLAMALAACGGGSDEEGEDSARSASLSPMAVGSRWVYRVTDPLTRAVQEKHTRVVRTEILDGAKAGVEVYVVESTVGDQVSRTWLEVKPEVVLRHREETLVGGLSSGYKLVVPYSFRAPRLLPQELATFSESYVEERYRSDGSLLRAESNSYTWKVESLRDRVTVPAGTFEAVKLVRTSAAKARVRTLWFAPGVGKVREDDAGYLEELVGVELP